MDTVTGTATAAKSLQSCPTLCDPIDGSPPGSPVPGILQARTLEWVAISFSNAWKWKAKVKSLSQVWPLATPWTAAYQVPLSMGFSRQEYWSGVPLASPSDREGGCYFKFSNQGQMLSLIRWHLSGTLNGVSELCRHLGEDSSRHRGQPVQKVRGPVLGCLKRKKQVVMGGAGEVMGKWQDMRSKRYWVQCRERCNLMWLKKKKNNTPTAMWETDEKGGWEWKRRRQRN